MSAPALPRLLPRLLLVTDRRRERSGALMQAIAAGAPFVQVREKDLDGAAVAQRLAQLRQASAGAAAPLLSVNGQPALARELGVGVHLPADHETVPRSGIPLLGRSVHDAGELRAALGQEVDYVVAGSVFPSDSKPGRAPLGLAALQALVASAAPVPVFAIGGITPARVADVRAAGAYGVAVCGAILAAADPAAMVRCFLEVLHHEPR